MNAIAYNLKFETVRLKWQVEVLEIVNFFIEIIFANKDFYLEITDFLFLEKILWQEFYSFSAF